MSLKTVVRNRKNYSDPKIVICDVIIAILCIVLLLCIAGTTSEFYTAFHSDFYSKNSFYYRLEDENYPEMLRMYYENNNSNQKTDPELKEYYGIAKYYEAAVNHRLYESTGDTEKSAKWQEAMESAKSEMGDYSFVSDNIDKKLAK